MTGELLLKQRERNAKNKIPNCSLCGRLLRSPRTRWVRGDSEHVACLACLTNANWVFKRGIKELNEIIVGEEWKLFSDNQFEGFRLLRVYKPW
jgi:hypothetical protein